MLKILHTSDLQLDAPFHFLGAKGKNHRQQLRRTFEKITKLAMSSSYDLLIIAGDLFNDNSPSQETVDYVKYHLENLAIPVVILPGNHDCYDSQSVYRRYSFPQNIKIIQERKSYLPFPDLDLTVAGSPILSPHDNQPLIRGLSRPTNTRWYIIVAHGSLQIPGRFESHARAIGLEEITSSNADYIALGDWHNFADYSQGSVRAFYSGAPEPTSLTQEGAGKVASITLSDQGVEVESLPIGTISTRSISLNISGSSARQIITRIRQEASPNLILKVTLNGMKRLGEPIDLEMDTDLSSYFYYLQIKDDSVTALDNISATDYPETHVIGQYIRLLQGKIVSAKSDDERKIAEQAMQLGVLLLQGKEVLK